MKERKKVVKKADLNSTAGKFLLARQKYKTKGEAALAVGIDPRNVNKLENTQMYQAVEKKYFRDAIADVITLESVALELKKNIEQDNELGAKNKAIEIYLSKVEPDKVSDNSENERVFVIVK